MYNDSWFKNSSVGQKRGIEDFYKRSDNNFFDSSDDSEEEISSKVFSEKKDISPNDVFQKISSSTEEKEVSSEVSSPVSMQHRPNRDFERKENRSGGFFPSLFGGGGLLGGGGIFRNGISGLFNRFQEDDLVLALVFFIIFNERNEDDWVLLIILAALFLT